MATVRHQKNKPAGTSFGSDMVIGKENIYKLPTPHINHKTMRIMKQFSKPRSKRLQTSKKIISNVSKDKTGICSCDDTKDEAENRRAHGFRNKGLKVQMKKSFQRIKRTGNSASNVRTGKVGHRQFETQSQTKKKKISTRSCHQFGELEKEFNFRQSCSIQLKSRVHSDAENLDFSDLVTRVPFPRKTLNEYDTKRHKRPALNIFGNKRNPSLPKIVSPTCGDMFGYDEMESLLSYSSIENTQKNLNHATEVKPTPCIETELDFQSSTGIIQCKGINCDVMSESTNGDRCVDTDGCGSADSVGSLCKNDSSPSIKKKQERLKLMKRAYVITNSVDFDDTLENPWLLKKDVTERATDTSFIPGYESLGFAVNTCSPAINQETESGVCSTFKRSDSESSLDSFGSSAHSVGEDALYFSDSEAEMQQDDMASTHPAYFTLPRAKRHNNLCSVPNRKWTVPDRKCSVPERKCSVPERKCSMPGRKKPVIDSLDDTDDEDDTCNSQFLFKTKLSRSSKLRQSVSLGNIIAKLRKPAGSVYKGMSFDSADRKDVNLSIWERRSLDGNMTTASCVSPFIEVDPAMTAISMLSPVMESSNAVIMRVNDDKTKNSGKYNTISHTRKGKGKSYPEGNQQMRKRSRIESFSKILSKRDKNDSNFELRQEKKERDKPSGSFFKTHSLTSLVSKGAASITNLITGHGRTNSSLAISSPFVQRSKKRSSNYEPNEFVYEKVKVIQPRKRPANVQEIVATKKRLKLALSFSSELPASGGLYYTHSPKGVARASIHSPTLLDEIMKSVGVATFSSTFFNSLDNSGNSDSDDEGSSKSSVNVPIYKQYSTGSDVVDLECMSLFEHGFILVSICNVCGKKRNTSDINSPAVEEQPYIRHSASLCDLNASCNCLYRQPRGNSANTIKRYRNSTDLSSEQMNSEMSFATHDSPRCAGKLSSCDLSSNFDSPEPVGDCTPFSQKQASASMYELRDLPQLPSLHFDEIDCSGRDTPGQDRTFTAAAQSEASQESQPGSLLRHRPILDLSVDDVDSAAENEASLATDPHYHLFSKSLGSLLPSSTSMSLFPSQNDEEMSHSFGNLLDGSRQREEICLIPQSHSDTPLKKEGRRMNVTSLSSSHDALTSLTIDELRTVTGNIDSDECPDTDTCTHFIKAAELYEKRTINVPTLKICLTCASLQKQNVNTFGDLSETVTKNNVDDVAFVDNVCQLCNRTQLNIIPKIVNNMTSCERMVKSVSDLDDDVNGEVCKFTNKGSKSSLTRKCNPYLLSPKSVQRYPHKYVRESRSLCSSPLANDKISPLTLKSATCSNRFLFAEHEIQKYAYSERFKSVSDDVLCAGTQRKIMLGDKPWSMQSLTRLGALSHSQDSFRALSYPSDYSDSPPVDCYKSPPFSKKISELSQVAATRGTSPECPLPEDVEEVSKYDVCLGYLLHSVTCDNKTICVYSLQRNKQLMEGVITPIAALPGVAHPMSDGHHGNKQKSHAKTKQEDMPNPAAPITIVPSDKLLHASHVLRTVLLLRASHMIRDRKFHLRTYRRCMVGTEMVDWLLQQSSLVHSRTQAVGMWQALVEEGVIVHVCHEHQFKDKYLFYRFSEDDEGVGTVPTGTSKKESDELQDIFLMLAQIGPDAMMRMILRKLPHERTMEDLEIIYEELLHIKALSHLSTMVKRELASVLVFESHAKAGTVLFNQGDEGKSWYITLKGSVNVVIYGKGVVCTLHEGDDFGKLALVNDAPRAATIVLRDDNCHFLRVDKDDFNRILRDVEANTVRLKEHGHDVLVLEKIPSNTQSADGTVQAHYKYSIMAGTPEKMLEHLLESRLDNKGEEEIDGFLEDFLLTHVIFMPCNHLCPVLISNYHSSMSDSTEQEAFEFMLNHKKCVLHFVQEWANIVGTAFCEDHTINAFLQELHSSVQEDLDAYPTLRDDLGTLDLVLQAATSSPDQRPRRKMGISQALGKKSPSKENMQDVLKKRKPIKATDENIFKVYCADHTYSTLRLPMDTTVEQIILSIRDKLCLGDDLVLCEVKSTGERVICKENDLCVTSGLSINGFLFITPREHLDALTPLPEQEGPSQGTWTMIEVVSSRELAYHMTTYDWELFTCVQEYELIYQVFGRHKFHKITANLDLFLKRFNEIQFWVVTEMVLQTNLSKRVSLLRKFIKLASYCKDFQNLNSFFAIVMGLSNIAVSRLSQTWEKLPGKFKKMFADFETLMDVSRNHRVYRLSVAKMVPPIIPFMPLLMKDMTFTHEGNKTYFDGLVNFEKMHMIAQTLKTVRFCRSSNLDLEIPGPLKSTEISGYIRNLNVIDNQRLLTQLSHKLEPRKT